MSCLRRLELVEAVFSSYTLSKDLVPSIHFITLPRLTSLVFRALVAHLEGIVVRLFAPSLQHLYIKPHDRTFLPSSFLHLSRFVRDMGKCLHASQVGFDRSTYSMHSNSVGSFGISIFASVASVTQMVGALSDKVATMDELILTGPCGPAYYDLGFGGPISWRRFYQLFCDEKGRLCTAGVGM